VHTIKPNPDVPSLNEEEEAELAALDVLLREENPESFLELELLKSEKIDQVISEFDTEEKVSRFRRVKEFYMKSFFKLRAIIIFHIINAYYFSKQSLKINFKTLKNRILSFILGFFSAYKAVPSIKKIKIIFSSFLIISLPFGIWHGVKKFLYFAPPGTVTDLSLFAESRIPLSQDDLTEDFLRSSRTPPNIFLINRFVVNLSGRGESGNPMLAAEIYLESLNPHALAEIKRREGFFRDNIINFSSQWTYEELATSEGKERYLNALRDELQTKINKGQLSRSYFKSIILKP